MKCPNCGKLFETRPCPSCREDTLKEALFCHRCGTRLETSPPLPDPEEEDVDFSRRILCSDGACIGVIDSKGFCKVCGKPYTGPP